MILSVLCNPDYSATYDCGAAVDELCGRKVE
jgi:hypothetical protein